MIWILLIALTGVILGAYLIVFRFLPRLASTKLKAAHIGAQTLVSMVTAIGISMAGLLYALERQWSPRFGVEVRTTAYPLRPASSPIAIVQVAVSITNQGRVAEKINGIEIGSVGIDPKMSQRVNRYGDLPGKAIQTFSSVQTTEIGAGETDFAYAELAVPCTFSVARIVVKVPQPPYRSDTPIGQRRVYQRKLIVPLSDACGRASAANAIVAQ